MWPSMAQSLSMSLPSEIIQSLDRYARFPEHNAREFGMGSKKDGLGTGKGWELSEESLVSWLRNCKPRIRALDIKIRRKV